MGPIFMRIIQSATFVALIFIAEHASAQNLITDGFVDAKGGLKAKRDYTLTNGQYEARCDGSFERLVTSSPITVTQPSILDITFSGAAQIRRSFARISIIVTRTDV